MLLSITTIYSFPEDYPLSGQRRRRLFLILFTAKDVFILWFFALLKYTPCHILDSFIYSVNLLESLVVNFNVTIDHHNLFIPIHWSYLLHIHHTRLHTWAPSDQWVCTDQSQSSGMGVQTNWNFRQTNWNFMVVYTLLKKHAFAVLKCQKNGLSDQSKLAQDQSYTRAYVGALRPRLVLRHFGLVRKTIFLTF